MRAPARQAAAVPVLASLACAALLCCGGISAVDVEPSPGAGNSGTSGAAASSGNSGLGGIGGSADATAGAAGAHPDVSVDPEVEPDGGSAGQSAGGAGGATPDATGDAADAAGSGGEDAIDASCTPVGGPCTMREQCCSNSCVYAKSTCTTAGWCFPDTEQCKHDDECCSHDCSGWCMPSSACGWSAGPCAMCIAGSCCSELTDCDADSLCSAMRWCLHNCFETQPGCFAKCADTSPSPAELALVACATAKCGQACGL
jgi:hypothetical protein